MKIGKRAGLVPSSTGASDGPARAWWTGFSEPGAEACSAEAEFAESDALLCRDSCAATKQPNKQ
jgi:hypothetical protein